MWSACCGNWQTFKVVNWLICEMTSSDISRKLRAKEGESYIVQIITSESELAPCFCKVEWFSLPLHLYYYVNTLLHTTHTHRYTHYKLTVSQLLAGFLLYFSTLPFSMKGMLFNLLSQRLTVSSLCLI